MKKYLNWYFVMKYQTWFALKCVVTKREIERLIERKRQTGRQEEERRWREIERK